MTVLLGIQKLLSIFSSAQAASGNESLCHYGQHQVLRYAHTTLDRRARHALAVFDVETPDGRKAQARLTAPQLGQAIKSYPDAQRESDSMLALRQAAVVVQAEDSLLHKPTDTARPSGPRVF